jgi:rhamnogalacturonan endolyase
VDLSYDGQAVGPTYPGVYSVTATINSPNHFGLAMQNLIVSTTALVRHAPTINGMIDGSVQLLLAESVTLNSGSTVSRDLLVRGTPTVQAGAKATLAGVIDGPGAATPSNHSLALGSGAVVRYVVRRIDPVDYPSVSTPPLPAGSRDVALSSSNKNPGDFGTLRNLALNNGAGIVVVPPGTYGAFTANGNTSFVLGVAGAEQPAVYNLQSLTLNSGSSVQVVGPVILTLANGTSLGGSIGNAAHPDWLVLRVASGGLTLNSGVAVRGSLVVPNGAIILNGSATIVGELVSDRLSVSSGGVIDEFTQ